MKALLFDFWGTLVETGVWSPVRQVKQIFDVKLPFTLYILSFEKAFMTADQTVQEGFQKAAKELRITVSDKQIEEATGMWNKSWMLATPYEDTIEMLKELRKEYKIFLVSNADASIMNVIERHNLAELFDGMYLSFQTGMLKGDSKLYQKIASDNGLELSDMMMIGDTMETDIIAPKQAGCNSLLIDRKDRKDHTPKIKQLSEIKDYL